MGGNKHCTSYLDNVTMLLFCSAILGMGTRTGKLRESTVGSKKVSKLVRKILPPNQNGKYEWWQRTEYGP